jgi:hypothetical protein
MTDAPNRRLHAAIAIVVLLGSCGWLFTQLGHYYFWDDEADTVLFAQGVWKTGDTTALVGQNLYAYRNGSLLSNLRNRSTPPLAYYVAAPFVGLSESDPFVSRLPFAVCGLLTVALLLVWLWQARADTQIWVLMAAGLLCNVSFFLFARQCRYYGLSILATTVIVYLYVRYDGRRRTLGLIALASIMLMATHYLNYAALYACLAIDYFAWRRQRHSLTSRDWLALIAPQVVAGFALLSVWNPLTHEVTLAAQDRNWLSDRLTLFGWNLRDLNACEFGAGILLLCAPLVAWWRKDVWLLRMFVAAVVYVVVTTFLSPQIAGFSDVADVRYLAPLIPLSIGLSVRTLSLATGGRCWLMAPLAVIAFGTNGLNLPWSPQAWRWTPVQFAKEIALQRATASEEVAKWINAHVAPGEAVWVAPGPGLAGHAYPLMIHAPYAVYAWQLDEPPGAQFAGLSDIHVVGRVPVDYMIAFGPADAQVREVIAHLRAAGHEYRQVASLDIFWKDAIRPELVWHRFRPVDKFDRIKEGIYIYRRVRP